MQQLIQTAKENPKTSAAGLSLLAVAGLNLAYVVAAAFINKTSPDSTALFQDVSIIVGFAVAGVLGLLASDPKQNGLVKFIAKHIPEGTQAEIVKQLTKIAGEAVEAGVAELEKPKK